MRCVLIDFTLVQVVMEALTKYTGGIFTVSGATRSLRGGAESSRFGSVKFALSSCTNFLDQAPIREYLHCRHSSGIASSIRVVIIICTVASL